MKDLNRCEFTGHLGAEVETRHTPSGDAVANFRVAVGDKWKTRDGPPAESTEWVRVVAWRKLAEICSNYLRKGSFVYVAGRMKTRKWTDKDGNDKYTTEIEAVDLIMLDKKPAGDQRSSAPPQQQSAPADAPPPGDDLDDDIPF